ncbi:hypothetical protein [Streptomyces sp. NPDC004008]
MASWWCAERDRPAFERLQQRLAGRGTTAAQAPREWSAHFVAFGLVHRGDDLTGWPYARRWRGLAAPFTLCPSTAPRPWRGIGWRAGGQGGGGAVLQAAEEWTRECVPSAIRGIVNTIIRFAEDVLRQEGKDTVDTLEARRTVLEP